MSQQLLEESLNDCAPTANEIVIGILEEVGNLSTLMEVFYFAREPDCLAVLRWLCMLPEEERRQLGEFAKSMSEGDSLCVQRPHPGSLTLTTVRRRIVSVTAGTNIAARS